MKLITQFLALLLCQAATACFAADTNAPALIPVPQKMVLGEGVFTLKPDTIICADHASVATANQLAARLRQSTGYPLKVSSRFFASRAIKNAILLTTKKAKASLGPEGYELAVATNSVVIRAPAQAGLFYGAQTLAQLLPPEIFSTNIVNTKAWQIPCAQIEDQPRFAWRGMMLDVSRDFFTKQEVERLLDLLALHKINTFHWHLVDNNGWRIEIKKYPKLTTIGAWREHSRVTPLRPSASNPESNTAHPAWADALPTAYGPDGRYGGFYPQKDIREVVAYAKALHITIVPEIELPGHSAAALSAYPELNCTGVTRGQVYCAGRDASFIFLQNVLTEVFQLFPGKYIHIGGDEVNTGNWSRCPECRARMENEGLTNVVQLQSYFIKRIEKFVNARGRKLVGWSEIMKGGLAKSATVMDWIGGGLESASAGHDVVMSPSSDAYLDHYQSQDHSTEPWAIGSYLPLSKVYAFEPIPAKLDPQFQSHILGAQGNLWTEYVASFKHVEYMAFPRMCAMAEVDWSPKEARNWDDFSRRLTTHLQRLDEWNVNYRPVSVVTQKPDSAR
jgi:hexosaminidase